VPAAALVARVVPVAAEALPVAVAVVLVLVP